MNGFQSPTVLMSDQSAFDSQDAFRVAIRQPNFRLRGRPFPGAETPAVAWPRSLGPSLSTADANGSVRLFLYISIDAEFRTMGGKLQLQVARAGPLSACPEGAGFRLANKGESAILWRPRFRRFDRKASDRSSNVRTDCQVLIRRWRKRIRPRKVRGSSLDSLSSFPPHPTPVVVLSPIVFFSFRALRNPCERRFRLVKAPAILPAQTAAMIHNRFCATTSAGEHSSGHLGGCRILPS